MQLDRNLNPTGKGKYALIKLRVAEPKVRIVPNPIEPIMAEVESRAIDFGDTPETEFFVIRLKDKYAYPALRAYALAAMIDDEEYANEIMKLAHAADMHPSKRKPD